MTPLLEERKPAGALILLRDVTDLRRRDRMLMSKDATIREIATPGRVDRYAAWSPRRP